VHLAHLDHVVATAIGRYRIRRKDPDSDNAKDWKARGYNDPRTLENTVVREWSWPCVLVFVDDWRTQEYFREKPDQIADLLIGPREGQSLATLPRDSGTLWVFDHEQTMDTARKEGTTGARARRYRPLALQWGGHMFMDAGGRTQYQFALATNLSTICRTLDVDVVRSWNIGHDE